MRPAQQPVSRSTFGPARDWQTFSTTSSEASGYEGNSWGPLRPLGISTLRDRVCMTAAMLVLEPIFEADLPSELYAYRPGRNTDQVQLSEEMLSELSQKSLEIYAPGDRPEAWVERSLDLAIEEADEGIVFIIANSGSGKSVSCYKQLLANAAAGGFSLILTDQVIASSLSLEQAVEQALVQLHPSLVAGCGVVALTLSSPSRRLLLTVEDLNRSGRGAALIERIAQWGSDRRTTNSPSSWQLLCPVWPQVMSSLNEDARRRIGSRVVVGTVFSADEGARAVERRHCRRVSILAAAKISEALGRDPLLIALHDPVNAADPSRTIAQFVETNLQRLAATKQEFSAAEYRKSLTSLARMMLLNRQLEPSWPALISWPILDGHAPRLRHMLHQRDLVRLAGPSTGEYLAFRHDRVRDWLLSQAAFELLHSNDMDVETAAEPFFAEIFGRALSHHKVSANDISLFAEHNPLALFCAIPHFSKPGTPEQAAIVAALEDWLKQFTVKAADKHYLRHEALRTLAEFEGPYVRSLLAPLDDNSWNALRARYRNGRRGKRRPRRICTIGLCVALDTVSRRCRRVAHFHSSGSPALRRASNAGCSTGLRPTSHLTLSLGLRRRASARGAFA